MNIICETKHLREVPSRDQKPQRSRHKDRRNLLFKSHRTCSPANCPQETSGSTCRLPDNNKTWMFSERRFEWSPMLWTLSRTLRSQSCGPPQIPFYRMLTGHGTFGCSAIRKCNRPYASRKTLEKTDIVRHTLESSRNLKQQRLQFRWTTWIWWALSWETMAVSHLEDEFSSRLILNLVKNLISYNNNESRVWAPSALLAERWQKDHRSPTQEVWTSPVWSPSNLSTDDINLLVLRSLSKERGSI